MGDVQRFLTDLAQRSGLGTTRRGVIVVGVALVVLGCAWTLWRSGPAVSDDQVVSVFGDEVSGASTDSSMPLDPDSGPAASGISDAAPLFVHVVGAVRSPGVYELSAGARVADAVEAAGGLLGNAAAQGVNLARPAADGEQLWVPTVDEFEAGLVPSSVRSDEGMTSAVSSLVNLNTADTVALESLPGIGPSTAQKVIDDREKNGPFERAEDLMRVSGIGPKKYEALADLITVP